MMGPEILEVVFRAIFELLAIVGAYIVTRRGVYLALSLLWPLDAVGETRVRPGSCHQKEA